MLNWFTNRSIQVFLTLLIALLASTTMSRAEAIVLTTQQVREALRVQLCSNENPEVGYKKITKKLSPFPTLLPSRHDIYAPISSPQSHRILVSGFANDCILSIEPVSSKVLSIAVRPEKPFIPLPSRKLSSIFERLENSEIQKCKDNFENEVRERLVAAGHDDFGSTSGIGVTICGHHYFTLVQDLQITIENRAINLRVIGNNLIFWEII